MECTDHNDSRREKVPCSCPHEQQSCRWVSNSCSKGVTIACCFLLCSTQGLLYTFGNINPYITSYLRNSTGAEDLDYTDTLWISQTRTITTNLLMPVVGLMANRIHTKLYLTIAILTQAAFLIGTYWSLKQSFVLVIVTYGVIGGIPDAIFYPTALKVAVGWCPEHRSFVIGVVLMGYGLGSLTWNELTTFFINPRNLSPDVRDGDDLYYTDADVLDNVPHCFILLAIIFAGIQILCTILLCTAPTPQVTNTTVKLESSKERTIGAAKEEKTPLNSNKKSYESMRDKQQVPVKENMDSRLEQPQYSPCEVLKSRVFWTIWFMFITTSLATAPVTSLFKAYGQTFISDDHFLALVASVSSVCNAAGRPFWGLLADRIGIRMVALLAQCAVSGLVATFVVCEEAGKAVFLVWVCAMFLFMCAILTMMPALIFALFGSKHFNVNMGLFDTSKILGPVVVAIISPILKDTYGWNGLFFTGFIGLFIGVLLNMSLSLYPSRIPRHMKPALSLSP